MSINLVHSSEAVSGPHIPRIYDNELELALTRLMINRSEDRQEMGILLKEMILEGEASDDEDLQDAAADLKRHLEQAAEPKGFSLASLWYLCCCFFERCGLDSVADYFARRLAKCALPYDVRCDLFNDFIAFYDSKYGQPGNVKRLKNPEDLMKFVRFLDASIRLFPQDARQWIIEKRSELGELVGPVLGGQVVNREQVGDVSPDETDPTGDLQSIDLSRYQSLLGLLNPDLQLSPLKDNGLEREYQPFKAMPGGDRRKQFYLELATCFEQSPGKPKDRGPSLTSQEAESFGLILDENQRGRTDLKVVTLSFHGAGSLSDFQCCAYNILDGSPGRLKGILATVEKILAQLKPNEIPVFVGHSMGGMFAHACGAYFHRASVGFNPLGCGAGVRKTVGTDNWLRAMYEEGDKHISFVSKGDWVNDGSPLTRKPLLGQAYKLEGLYNSTKDIFLSNELHNEIFALIDAEEKPKGDANFSKPILLRKEQIEGSRRRAERFRNWAMKRWGMDSQATDRSVATAKGTPPPPAPSTVSVP